MSATTLSATDTVAFDNTYSYRIRAVDAVGHWSPWAVMAGTGRYHAYDDRSSRIVRAGPWTSYTSTQAFRATLLGASRASASLTMSFTGRSLAIVAMKSPHRGTFTVWIDGVAVKTISLNRSTTAQRQVVFSWYSAAGGPHTVALRPTGTGTYRLIKIDAFVVGR
jgi:hypothetical protein